jgi:integrase
MILVSKRFRGEGTVAYNECRQNYVARFSYTDIKNGAVKRKSFSAKSAQEALRRGKKWKKDIEAGLLPDGEKTTLWEWLNFWLVNYAKNKVRAKTFDKYESCLRCYIKPNLGNIAIRKVTGILVQQVFNELLVTGGEKGKGISSSTVNATRKYLRAAFDQAQKDGIVKNNAVENTVAVKTIKRDIQILTFEQSKNLIEQSKNFKKQYGPVPYMLLLLSLETGMRLGELIALKWECVNLTSGLIYVKRSANTSKPSLKFQEPKTKRSIRQISLMKSTILALEKYKNWQDSYKIMLGDKYKDNDLVIVNLFGNILHPSNFTKRIFKPLLSKVGIDHAFRFHDLRHTHASQLLMVGANPKIVQERLGHSTIAMTLNTYSHLLPSMQNEAVKVLEQKLREV